jgi:cephalosporin-C deacetylase-like acetyl esterase
MKESDLDRWIEKLFQESEENPAEAELFDPESYEWPEAGNLPFHYAVRHQKGTAYVRFTPQQGDPFFCIWQPAFDYPAPLLIHLPGYGAEMSIHPEIMAEGFNILHINPLGYCTPGGMQPAKSRQPDDPLGWPHLQETITSYGEKGYRQWFVNCIQSVAWAAERSEVLPGRFSFFGTSQGGGAALILASMYRDRGVRCAAADVPFLTNYPLAAGRGAYEIAAGALEDAQDKERAWKALKYIDTVSHAPRLTFPVLLTAGSDDEMCPPETIEALFAELPRTRSLTYIRGREHAYTPEFLFLAKAWFRMYA